MLQLAAFLGNPGLEYERSRHNAGWMLADALPCAPLLNWHKKYKGLYASMDGIHFIKPQQYMNRSGEPVQAAASFFKIKVEKIIVIYDEIELPFGTVSLKWGGGLGGHNGLRSMKASFGSADFWRLRIGIGRPDARIPGKGGKQMHGKAVWMNDTICRSPDEGRIETKGGFALANLAGGNLADSQNANIADWVLSDFTAAEAEALAPVFAAGAELLAQAFTIGPECLLPEWAKKNCLVHQCNQPPDPL